MAIFKCKMCGGSLDVSVGTSVIECEYCGTAQTLPKLDDDRRVTLYDRANHFRRNNDFDKAAGIYETILNEDNTDAEAYWSLVLCRYGIEYVEDPKTHTRVPTVNRAQFTSIYDDENYKSAINYASIEQKAIYEREAEVINNIQKGILEISTKEEPFDIFICYKESDAKGNRTHDSVLAQELYYNLTGEGFKVFFARITLEDKLGSAYEPYIFAALNSAKVMVVLGTKIEYFNAVWVKNEWSRYLALIKGGAKKTLIPAYRDVDPYDLPDEFSHLQAQDMAKLGFMQDLVRGIKKIIGDNKPKAAPKVETKTEAPKPASNDTTAPLLRRARLFLEDGEWENANEYAEKVLDTLPECAEAYVIKMLIDLRLNSESELATYNKAFDDNPNYKKAIRFASPELKEKLAGYNRAIIERAENERLEDIYKNAVRAQENARAHDGFTKAKALFDSIPGYKDADERAAICKKAAENARLQGTYEQACYLFNTSNSAQGFERAKSLFKAIPGYKDSDALALKCDEKAEIARKEHVYVTASKYMLDNNPVSNNEAIRLFEAIPGYKDADEKAANCKNRIEILKKADQKRKKIKKIAIISVIAVILLALTTTTVIVSVDKHARNGLNLELNDDGTGYVVKAANKKYSGDIVIPSKYRGKPVVAIDNQAFYYCTDLTGITIPNSVTYIGFAAFYSCNSLTSVTIGNGVTSIGDWTFFDCDSLTSITLPDSVTSIGRSAFKNCDGLTSVTIGNGVTSIGDSAFYNCDSLTSVTIGNSVTSIGDNAFSGCNSLTSVTLPDSVTSIGGSAFQGCDSLTSVTIGNGVTSIGGSAFYHCDSLTSVKYRGTLSQWHTIWKGYNWNYYTGNYTITYNYTGE